MSHPITFVPPEGGKATWFLGHLFVKKADGQVTSGAYSLVEHLVAPLPLIGAPPHVHHGEDEAFYVLDGTVSFQVGDRRVEAGPGSFVLVPRGTLHGFSNPGEKPARVLVIISPSGFERFFEEAGEPARSRTLPPSPSGPPDVERLSAIGRKYNLEIKGPSPGP